MNIMEAKFINWLKGFDITGLLDHLNITNEIKQTIENRILEYQSEEYKRNLFNKTLLHRHEPVKLYDFYLPLYITPLKKTLQDYKQESVRIPTNSATTLFNTYKFISIVGYAGSGKSTIVKYLLLKCIEEQFKIPIKIELRYLSDYTDGLKKYIIEEILKFQGIATNDRVINRLLNHGSFVFFLDGFDEISSTRRQTIQKEISDFTKRFNKNNYLLTSRPHTNVELLPLFQNFSVCDLNETEIQNFIHKQMSRGEEQLAIKIIQAIDTPENASFISFLSNPLLLSMFILTFQNYAIIPQRRSSFYGQVFDTLYSMHDSMSKLGFTREKLSGLSKDQFLETLKYFSYISYFEEEFNFSEEYINRLFNIIKEKKQNLRFENFKLLEDMLLNVCIFSKEGLEYVFSHRSLQEYFAALFVSGLTLTNRSSFYNKIWEKMQSSYDYIFFHENFFILLRELDMVYINKFLTLPMLRFCCNNFENISKTKKDDIEKSIGLLDMSLSASFVLHEIPEEIVNGFSVFFRDYYIRRKKNKLTLRAFRDIIDQHNVLFQNIVIKLKKEIEHIEQMLAKNDKSDLDILNIV